ncbi:MAG: CotH kinase family protein [Myxococcota bacterium]
MSGYTASLRRGLPIAAIAAALAGCAPPDDGVDRRCRFEPDGHGTPSGLLRFSRDGGLFTLGFSLTVESPLAGTLRYTLDGCPPDADSPRLDGPLDIDATTEVRVGLFDSEQDSPPRSSRVYIAADPELRHESELPIVVVETWGQPGIEQIERPRVHRPAYLVVIEPGDDGIARLDDPPTFAGRIGMHIRGNSTAEQYRKKQYKLELWDEFDRDLAQPMLGMPAEADWVLHAPHSDKTFMRNHLVYRWSNRMGRWAARTRFVETLIDRGDTLDSSDYVGVYVWMDKIEVGPNRVSVTPLEPEDADESTLAGGYLLVRDWDHHERALRTETYRDAILVDDPRPEDITPAQRSWIADYLNAFERALSGPDFQDPQRGYAPYIDIDAFIDHHLLVELARNVDGFVLSTYMHKEREGPLVMGPVWDYNGSLGNADYYGAWDPEGWHHEHPDFPGDNPQGYRWYERLFEDPAFVARYAERWRALRAGPLATDALLADIDEASALLQRPAMRNFERWPILGRYVWPNDEGHEQRGSFDDEVDYLRQWLLARVAWMDAQLGSAG